MKVFRNLLIAILNRVSCFFSDSLFLRIQFRLRMGYRLNIESPKTLSEKIQWLKLYDRNIEYTKLVDKYEVKLIVAQKIGKKHVIPTLMVWDKVEQINFDCLPMQFVLKTTHGGGNNGVIICKDKDKIDVKNTIERLKKALRQNIFNDFREWPYKNIQKRVIAEKFMEQDNGVSLIDYKFFCFNGIPKYVYVSQNNTSSKRQLSCFLTMNWKLAPFKKRDDEFASQVPTRPSSFESMFQIAKKLCEGYPFVRVDLYEINNQVFFSELTFYPSSGMHPIEPLEWDLKLGDILRLPEKRKQ